MTVPTADPFSRDAEALRSGAILNGSWRWAVAIMGWRADRRLGVPCRHSAATPVGGYAGGMSTTLDFPMSASSGTDDSRRRAGDRAVRRRRLRPPARPRLHLRRARPTCVERIGVGKRVEAPFGRGDKRDRRLLRPRHATTPPPRAVKAITRVLDDEALLDRPPPAADALDGGLLPVRLGPGAQRRRAGRRRATRPAPARRSSSSRCRTTELPNPLPTLTRQADGACSTSCAKAGRPVEQRAAVPGWPTCGPAPIAALVDEGAGPASSCERVERVDRTAAGRRSSADDCREPPHRP